MKLSPFRTFTTILALALVSAARAEESPPKGVRLFTCAHSFHAFVYRQLDGIAKSAGIADHKGVGISSIGGSQVIRHWDVPDEKNECKKALTAGNVDVLTLAPIWMPDQGIDNFAKLGFEHNPNLRITVQEFWLPNDTYEPKYPLDTRKQVDHDATNPAELKQKQDQYDHDVDEYVKGINKRLGKDLIVTVPVGQAAAALRAKIVKGEVPGLPKQWGLFRDMWGHPQIPLQILSAYCHYAVIYKRSPVGLPLPEDFARAHVKPKEQDAAKDKADAKVKVKGKNVILYHPEWDEKLNRLLQELAWDAVIHHPMSGVTAETK